MDGLRYALDAMVGAKGKGLNVECNSPVMESALIETAPLNYYVFPMTQKLKRAVSSGLILFGDLNQFFLVARYEVLFILMFVNVK
jgi:hypothetical protein